MNKRTIFSQTLDIVAQLTDLPVERIIGTARDAETTDARYIVATLLKERGFSPVQISQLLHRTPRSVRWLLSRSTNTMQHIYLTRARQWQQTSGDT